MCAGDGFLAEEVGAAIDGEAQVAGENAQLQAGIGELEAGAIGFDAAGTGLVSGPRSADLFGFARQFEASGPGDIERRVPEGVPLFLFDHRGSEFHLEGAKGTGLLLRHAADSAGDFKFRSDIAGNNDPASLAFTGSEFLNERLAIADDELRAQLLVVLALPGDLGGAGGGFDFDSVRRFVFLEIASLGDGQSAEHHG